MASSHKSVEEGIARATEVNEALERIDRVVGRLHRFSIELEEATLVQVEGAETIAESARDLESGTADLGGTLATMRSSVAANAASVSQLAQAAQAARPLSEQAERLHALLSRFRVGER